MILQDLKKGDRIKIDGKDDKGNKIDFVIFDHLDGMYSYCYAENDHSKLLHLRFDTPLIKENNYYLIK